MKQDYITQVAKDIVATVIHYKLKPPLSYQDYDAIVNIIKKHHRATLTVHGVSASKDIIPKVLNMLSVVPPPSVTYLQIENYCNLHSINFYLLEEVLPYKVTRRHKVKLVCTVCAYEETITVASAIRRSSGCKKCNGKLPIYLDDSDVKESVYERGFAVLEIYKDVDRSGYLAKLQCNNCGLSTVRTVAHLKYKHSTIYCERCNPPPIYGKLGTRSEYLGISFDSEIELQAYKKLESLNTNIIVHQSYSSLGVPNSSLIADFLVANNYIVEVSSFAIKHHEDYHKKVALKQYLIEHYTDYTFIFCNSLAEVSDFICTYKYIHN